jgi:outer membrane receptor protein involved in Fe transport
MKLLSILLLLSPPALPAPSADTATHALQAITVSAPLKQSHWEGSTTATVLTMGELETGRVTEPKNLSLRVPNLLHADYGARMTGSIYIRGIGSRMDQPAMGLYVDNVPVLNKNNYDFDYFDLRRLDVLRGPQGTLYGRNTIGGVIDVQTLSPFDVQGVRAGAGYGNGNTFHAQAALYRRPTERFGFSVAASHRRGDGFFTNEHDGSDADRMRSSAVRARIQARLSGGWTLENSLYANVVRQNGFAYAPFDEASGLIGPIDHNDPCTYDRFGLTNGLTFRREGGRIRLSSTTSYQYTDDRMVLDQDFSPRSLFTLKQLQREHAVTEEFVVRSASRGWQWITGFFGFYRGLDSQAPVTLKRDGIDELILANANAGIHTVFPQADLLIDGERLPIDSDFELPAFGLSLYHQSTWNAGRWRLTAGVRADYEHTAIRYANSAEIHYRFTLTMPEYRALPVAMEGRRDKSYFEVMPRAAVLYETPFGNLYASAARGYKAGGYNTQIFSDILQNRMMSEMMADLGLYLDGAGPTYRVEEAISYKPEQSWNYELGGRFSAPGGRLRIEAALFYIDCRNQQLTVFPPGRGTGRLMSNAGRTRSAGAEVTVDYRAGNFGLSGSYGYTNARFVDYNDGREDYAGKTIPYAPQNTASAQVEYRLDLLRGGHLFFTLGGQGAGRIYWNESNTVSQPFYALLDASLAWKTGRRTLTLWARNLTGTDYNTFYFKSVGRSFVQRGKPLQAGISLNLDL